MDERGCLACAERETCEIPCKHVKDVLYKDNHVMEVHFQNGIVVFPKKGEVHFCEISEQEQEGFSDEDVIPWSSEDTNLTQTAVFIERFFNRIPAKELAERFGVKPNTIISMYRNAVCHLEKMIEVLDARKEGIKAMKPDIFTEEQKFFLLCHVFGFSQAEIARMFKRHKNVVNHKVKRLADKYRAAFASDSPTLPP